ncbi:MAG: HAD family hydrolase [Halodesulfovibrio sp.]
MLRIDIPGRGPLTLSTLILDYNGTLAKDGTLLDGVAERLQALGPLLHIIVLTADTHGTVARNMQGLPVEVVVIGAAKPDSVKEGEDEAKLRVLTGQGCDTCAAFGNGRNDNLMLGKAALSVAVLGDEGLSTAALGAAQVVVKDIRDGLDLLLKTNRLRATLRF